ncbi:MAG: hypothetical protein KJ774_09130 [Firmicutes bacterium]|nr:hypothetical protein [Bacillota bacterium]
MKKITVSILTTLLMLSMVFSSSVFAANEKVSAWDSFLGLSGVKATETSDVGVEYRGHVENKGDFPLDGSWIQGPNRLGTVGEGLRLEAFWIKLTDAPEGLHIKYEVHVQNKGWMAPVEDGKLAGTQAEGLRIEAIKISLVDDEGNVSGDYSVTYKGHIQNEGDTDWIKSGLQLGTTGSGLRLEALEVKIEKIAPDLSDYEAALAAVTEANYTKASWATYQDVVEDNVMTEDNVQSEVDAATAIILDAQEDLVTVPVISAVTATAQKTLTVTGTELSKLATSMFTVAGNTVTAVTPNADGTSATLTLGTNLVPDTNVKVTATIDGTTKEYTVKYTIAATTVVIQDQTFDTILENQKVALLVNGVSTTADYLAEQNYTVSFVTWNSNGAVVNSLLNASTGLITVVQPTEADYTVQVTIAKGATVVTSAKANLKIRNLNNNVSDITAYTLTNGVNGDSFVNASKSLVVNESAKITKVVVGYGTAAAELSNQVGYTVTSDNSAVASVNSTGVITATGLGTANLTITAGKATYTVPLTVVGTARKATTVALKDGAATFTAVISNTVTNTMTVQVKDQYGDPFVGATGVTYAAPGSIKDITLNPATALGTPPNTADGKKGLVDITVTLGSNAVAGQSGNVVFRNSDNTVIGSATIVTSSNNMPTSTKLVVTGGPTNNTIDNELASKSAITYKVGNFNSAGVQIGTAPSLAGYTVTCDKTIVSIATAAANATGYTISSGDSFVVTGLKAGTTALLVKDPLGNVVDSISVTVLTGTVKISSVSFLAPGTIANASKINYATVLGLTDVATGRDPVVTGVTTTPTSVYSVRICLTATTGITAGQIYLDKADSIANTGVYNDGTDKILGTLTETLTQGSGTSPWTTTTTDPVTGFTTVAGNKGTITFNITDYTSTDTIKPVIASTGVVVAVPGSTAIGVTGNSSITQGAAVVPAVAATGTVTFGTPAASDTVTVDTTTFSYASPVTIPASQYSTAAQLTALIDGLASVTATNNAGTITVTAATAGAAGDSIALAEVGTGITVSGANLTGGADLIPATKEKLDYTVATPAGATGNIAVIVNGTTHIVAVTSGDSAAQVAAKISAQLVTDTVTGYDVSVAGAIVTLTAQTAGVVTPDPTMSIFAN